MRVTCSFCGAEMDEDYSYQRQDGWARNRRKGEHGLSLRRPLPEWACVPCIERKKQGIPVGQSALAL